ncbi:MAG: DUF4124 domain-containing protein [Steroidobacteraceae bacterium]
MKRLVLCAALLAFSAMSPAAVYKWVDSQGKTQYGDRPPDGVKAELVTLLGNRAPGSQSTRPSAAHSTAPGNTTSNGTPVGNDAKKAVEQDVSAARAKQCADAQERYRKLIEGRRIYREGKDGERQYLSSEELDSARLNAKADVDATCNSAT